MHGDIWRRQWELTENRVTISLMLITNYNNPFLSAHSAQHLCVCYFTGTFNVNFEFKFMRLGEDGGDINTPNNFEGKISNERRMNQNF
jgi:hypothetical protein